ncbi:hypothetical protein [uncultured Kordia sp.]|uniref:hypothetical protein n=1 Tax=uncultured Kordia sp. TaxID=507699 RepID=UPI002630EDE4|nr:hypothetical protein [uncultured Kordia sp.]
MNKTILLLFLCATAFFTSCSSSDDSIEEPTPEESFIRATIDDAEQNADIIGYSTSTTNGGSSILYSITGTINTDTTNNTILLNIIDDETGANAALFDLPIRVFYNGVDYSDSDGTIAINVTINNSEKIEGTFSGELREASNPGSNIQITNGSFRILL